MDTLLRSIERRHAGRHRKTSGGLRAVGLDGACQFDDLGRAGQPPQAPTSHRIGFAKAVDDHRALGHPRFSRQAIVNRAVIENVLINLIT